MLCDTGLVIFEIERDGQRGLIAGQQGFIGRESLLSHAQLAS
jgi:hypothetical protein